MEYRIGGATYSCLMGKQTKFCLQIALLVLIVTLVFVYFKLPSGDSLPDGRLEPSGEPDALDKYLNQQFQFLGVGGKQKNALDPKVKEMEQYQQLVQSISHNSDANCRLTEYMIRNGSCKAGINETTSYSDILGTQVYTVMTTCAGEHMKRPWVLFLHGMAYTTRVWVETNIMRMTASFGFNSIAIDLPGFGNSKGSKKVSSEVEFINDLIDSLKITKFVIVSPSMSGRYSIPYLKTLNPKLVGFVAAAPTSTELLTGTDATTIETPVLIMKGERDNQLGKVSLDNLSRLQHSTTFIVPDAGHPSYVDNTPVFTRKMIKFLLCMSSETQ